MITAIELSSNRKTGPVSATYAPRQTCPPGCRFLRNGCYAENQPCVFTFSRVTKQAKGKSLIDIARAEATAISELSGRYPLRLHVSGDCRTPQAAREIASACQVFTQKHGCPVWSYTHAWRKIPRENWGKINIFASCEAENDAVLAHKRGYSVAIVRAELPKKPVKIGNFTGIPCKEQLKGTPCVSCRLCFHADKLRQKGKIIVFGAHGSRHKRVKGVLNNV
jgi:hypothetical protein